MKLICLQSSILSQGTVGCQEFLIYLGVDTITLSVSDTPLPHVKKKKKEWRKKKGHPCLFQLRFVGPHVGGWWFAAVAAVPQTLKPTDTLHSTASVCCRDSIATFSSLTDPGCVRPCVVCILARKCRRAKNHTQISELWDPCHVWMGTGGNDWKYR